MNLRSFIFYLRKCLKNFSFSSGMRIIRVPAIFQDHTYHHDNSTVVLYTDDELIWPEYSLRQKTTRIKGNSINIKSSLIASVKNEKENIDMWVERIYSQTCKPSEIIIVDGGSTDGTLDLLYRQRENCPIPIIVLSNPGGNIAQGRNLAIKISTHEIIAVTDFGCLPATDWLEKILNPFIIDPEIVVSAGIYDPVYPSSKTNSMKKLWLWASPAKISPQNYLPPGGSAAFKKFAWFQVGGYPEWLTMTGEDTFFDLELKQLGGKWAFVPDAIVHWNAPAKFIAYLKKLYNWTIGDGEMKIHGEYYWKFSIKSIVFLIGFLITIIFPIIGSYYFNLPLTILFYYFPILFLLGLIRLHIWSRNNDLPLQLYLHRFFGGISQLFGYIQGSRRQGSINSKRYASTKGLAILLSGVPIDDTGGGARCTQIAMELLDKNFIVIFLYRFPKNETKNLNLSITHRNLIVKSIKEINPKTLIKSIQGIHFPKNLIAITEHPIQDFLPVIDYVNKLGGKTIYDNIDDWETSLGGKWYSANIERQIISQSQILTATAPILADRLTELSKRKVHLLPNAVNPTLFNPDSSFSLPQDMPGGIWSGIYIGALWGDWFDWNLLTEIAETYPNAVFTIIGDHRGNTRSFPANIHFLGLKKQCDLPAYLKFSNVAIIPWKVNKITQSTSPLKVYEFLAMRCPVVAPNLMPLDGIPGVYQAKDKDDFINCLDFVRKVTLDVKINTSFIAANNWETRIQQLLNLSP